MLLREELSVRESSAFLKVLGSSHVKSDTNIEIPTSIQTFGGHQFNFLDPQSSIFTIEDVAQALSNICRFTGHVKEFYSVAQHCVLVSNLVPKEFAMHGLLHDAAEAFIGDVSTPLKMLLPQYKEIERAVEDAVFSRFGVLHMPHEIVKMADLQALKLEKRDLMGGPDWEYLAHIKLLDVKIEPVTPASAKELFLHRYAEILQMKEDDVSREQVRQRA